MKRTTILMLSDPREPQVAMLDELREAADVAVGDSAKALEASAPKAEILLNWSGTLSLMREVFLMCRRLRWIHSRSVGLERTLFPELIASDITLTHGRGVFSPPLGEFALAAILYFAKDLRRMIRNQQRGLWEPFDVTLVSGQTVGIVGYGDIGRAVATRVRAVGMKVLALRRHVPANPDAGDPLIERYYPPANLKEMLALCDYVVATAPLTEQTRHMISDAEFAAMKPPAVLINVGR